MHLEQSSRACKGIWRNWRSEEGSRPYRPQYCSDQQEYIEEYIEETRRPEKICCHSDSSEKTPVNTGMKKIARSEMITEDSHKI